MKIILLLVCSLVVLLPAAETIQSGTVAVTATEDSVNNTITYANIRDALVTGSSPASSSTYKYRIKTVGTSTKVLQTSAPADVVPGTTVVVPSSPGVNETPFLLYTPADDEFTLFPTTSDRSIPAVAIATVDVLDTAGAVVLATVDLRIDIQGVTDTREGVSGYYKSQIITWPAPIVIPRGGSVQMNYVEFAARCGFVDKERDGYAEFATLYPSGVHGGGDGWSLVIDNHPSAPSGDSTFVKGVDLEPGRFCYGRSSDYATDSLTLSIPSNHPLGTFDLMRIAFAYDPDGEGGAAATANTNLVNLSVTVVAAGGGGSSGGGSGGGGGCGLGALSSVLALAFLALGVRLWGTR